MANGERGAEHRPGPHARTFPVPTRARRRESERYPRTFRTSLALRVALVAAAGFWAAALWTLLRGPGGSPAVVGGAAALVAFFLASAFLYTRTSITVTPDGLVAATPFRRRPVRYDEIVRVIVRDGVGGRVYAVLTRRGPITFTSLFARHRELFELILERARLNPQPA